MILFDIAIDSRNRENIATDPIVSKDVRDSEIKQEYLLFSFKI